MDRVYFGVFLGCDLANVDLRGVGDGCERGREGWELKQRERLTTTVLATYCRASSRKRASAVCWEEAFSAMTVEEGLERKEV